MKQSMKDILTEMYKITTENDDEIKSRVDSLRKKFTNFFNIVCEFDFDKEIQITELSPETYKYFKDEMVDLVKRYTIHNIADWTAIDNASKLYCIDGKNEKVDILQLQFYREFRMLVYGMVKMEHKSPLNKNILDMQDKMEDIYFSLQGHLRKICTKQEPSKTEDIKKCSINDLKNQLKELKELEKSGSESFTRREILMMIIDVQNSLLKMYNENPRAYKVPISKIKEDFSIYEKKYLKERLHMGRQNSLFVDYLKRSLWEEDDVFPYELDPNQRDLFERCFRKYQAKSVELINTIIEETEKEIQEEQNQMNTDF